MSQLFINGITDANGTVPVHVTTIKSDDRNPLYDLYYIAGWYYVSGKCWMNDGQLYSEITLTSNAYGVLSKVLNIQHTYIHNMGYYACLYIGVNAYEFVAMMKNHTLNPSTLSCCSKYNTESVIQNLPCSIVLEKGTQLPTKAHASDAGYDLTVISKSKDINTVTALYETGVRIQVPVGYYVEVVPRSSLSKSGYIMTNSIGIIDASYTGTIKISLTRVDSESPDIQFPFRCAQMIVRKQYGMSLMIVDTLTGSNRGSGGFGSSGI